jgi:hypothetical protein
MHLLFRCAVPTNSRPFVVARNTCIVPKRHTYRSWLDATGAAISVQQKMMRHASIKTTMDIYGDVVTDEMSTASRKVAELVFPSNGAQAERKAS